MLFVYVCVSFLGRAEFIFYEILKPRSLCTPGMGGPQKHMSCINRWKHGWTGRWVGRWMGDGRVDGWVGRWVRLDWAGSKALSDDGIYLQRSVSFTAFSVQRLALRGLLHWPHPASFTSGLRVQCLPCPPSP